MKNKPEMQEGSITIVGLVLIFVSLLVVFTTIYFIALFTEMESLKNQCDFSNLSAYKNISQTNMAATGNVVFNYADLNSAYDTYKTFLIKNLGTDSNLKVANADSNIIDYTISQFIIYNVVNGKTTEYQYNSSSNSFITVDLNDSNSITTPTGRTVVNTSIYTEVTCNMNLILVSQYKQSIHSYTDAVNNK